MHTFVIPVYKESPYLEKCIGSLLAQTVKSSVVLTTSTPTEFSKNIAEKYQLPYFIHNNKGIAADWNFALSKVTTPLATIAHQDDIYEPEYAESVINAAGKDSLIIFTNYRDVVGETIREASLNSFVKNALLFPFAFSKSISSRRSKRMLLAFGDPICCPSVTFNLDNLKGFSFSTELTCALDWYAWFQMANREGSFSYIDKKLMQHRIHPESETNVQIAQGIRRQEELYMFRLMWGKRSAAFISWLYTLGHAANKA